MTLKSLAPTLYTKQVKETVKFYTTVLGFTCNNFMDDWGWVSMSRDEVEIMIAYPNSHLTFEKPCFTGSFYIQTDNADSVFDQLKDKVKICYPIETFDYGMREFAIYDNNGYLIQFGNPV